MIDQTTIESLKKKYSHLHPLIFQRSLEKSETAGKLFDILDSVPDEYPIVWDETEKRWKKAKNLFQFVNFDENPN